MEFFNLSCIDQWRQIAIAMLNKSLVSVAFDTKRMNQFSILSESMDIMATFLYDYDSKQFREIQINIKADSGHLISLGCIRISYIVDEVSSRVVLHKFIKVKEGMNIKSINDFMESLYSVLIAFGFINDDKKQDIQER